MAAGKTVYLSKKEWLALWNCVSEASSKIEAADQDYIDIVKCDLRIANEFLEKAR